MRHIDNQETKEARKLSQESREKHRNREFFPCHFMVEMLITREKGTVQYTIRCLNLELGGLVLAIKIGKSMAKACH